MVLSMYTPSVLNADPFILAIPAAMLVLLIIMSFFLSRYYRQKENMLLTERQLTSQNSLKTVLDALPIPVRMTDLHSSEVVYVNDCFIKVFELPSAEDIIGHNIYHLVSETQSDRKSGPDKFKQIYESGGNFSLEIRYRTAKGSFFDALLISCYIEYNGIPCSLGIIKDLTAEKKSQKILLNAVKREKEESLLKSKILDSLSHEIRSPMNAIIGLTQVEMYKNAPQESLLIYKKVNTSARNLLQTIDDFLTLSNIDINNLELKVEEFELDDVLNNALLIVSQHFEGQSEVMLLLNASLDLPRYIVGDKLRLWQILKGFLDNSVKYTKSGKIVLSVSLDNDKTNEHIAYITFLIKDTGVGVNREQKLNPGETEYNVENHGVLAAKRLCTLMNGDLEIECDDTGALIRFTIPFKRSMNEETTMEAIETPMLSGLNFLIVDDDELSLKIMERLLKCSYANCVLARSGNEALETVAAYREMGKSFDVVLLDYMMSDINGFVTAYNIHLSLLKIPKIIIVTAYHKRMLEDNVVYAYVDAIIEKPFVPSQFIRKICSVLGVHEMRDELDEELIKYENAQVLICEDNIINQEITASMLEEFGITSIIAENGVKCLEILNRGVKVDLILMDLFMPEMDGFETTAALRADQNFADIPIISLTADALPHIVEKCVECGMSFHLSKPVEFKELNAVLKDFMPSHKRAEL